MSYLNPWDTPLAAWVRELQEAGVASAKLVMSDKADRPVLAVIAITEPELCALVLDAVAPIIAAYEER